MNMRPPSAAAAAPPFAVGVSTDVLLTPHFWLGEMTASQAAVRGGLSNVPTPRALENLRRLCGRLEQVRDVLGAMPMRVSSGYRSPAVNGAVGGSLSSAHTKGLAVDFTCPDYGSPLKVAQAIARSAIAFDQLIYEGSWVHFAIEDAPAPGLTGAPAPRRQVLTAVFGKGRPVTYLSGLVVAPGAAREGG